MFGILVALPVETRRIVAQRMQVGDIYPLSDHARLIVIGMGEAALPIIRHHAQSGQFSTLISLGSAVGLSPLLNSGTVCIPDEVVMDEHTLTCHQGLQTQFISALTNNHQIVQNRLSHTSHVLTNIEEKINLSHTAEAVAADMESFLIAQEAQRHQIDFLAVRVILDTVHLHLPPALLDCCLPTLSALKLIGTLLQQPRWFMTLWVFAQHFKQVQKTLRVIAQVAVLQAKIRNNRHHVI